MPAVNPSTAVLEKLQSDIDLDIDVTKHADVIMLTPHLVLAVSMLYMMASDGTIEDEESSQLQASLGGHETLLQFALRYVQVVPVDRFLQKAPEVLSAQDKLCILSNVCDSMLSDGRSEAAELALFEQFVTSFGLSQSAFETFFKTIALKNDKSVLGRYEPPESASPKMSPHLALAASLLYMMTSDGSIGAEEIGLLEGVIGEFEGLQQVALAYVRAVKRTEFLKVAAPLLSQQQKLYILTNVSDSMLSDGSVAALEDKLFVSMLKAFGYTEKTFQPYYQVIEAKNIKPFDTSKFKLSTQHTRLMAREAQEGEVFDNIVADEKNLQKVDAGSATQGAKNNLATDVAQGSMGSVIHRTMQDNIANVNQDFGGEDNVVKVGLNATDQLNVQKIDQSADAANLQKVTDSTSSANVQTLATDESTGDNRQLLASASQVDNRQTIENEQKQANKQNIDADLYATYGAPVGVDRLSDNVQELPQETLQPNVQTIAEDVSITNQALFDTQDDEADPSEILTPEVRVKNLFEDIDTLNRKLDDFEEKNKKMLAAAKQARKESQRREAQALADALNRQSLQESAEQPNFQPVESDALPVNLQEVAIDRLQSNDPKISKSVTTSFVRWSNSASQPHGVETEGSTEAPTNGNKAKQQMQMTLQQPEQIWIGAKPAASNGLFSEGDDEGVLSALGAEGASLVAASPSGSASGQSAARRKRAKHHGQGSAGAGIPFKVYVKATVTFVVLSCWASSISAIDSVRTKRFVGALERAPVVMLTQELMQTQE